MSALDFDSVFGTRRGAGRPPEPDRYPPGALHEQILAACAQRPWWPAELVDPRLRFLALARSLAGAPVPLGKARGLQGALDIFQELQPQGYEAWLIIELHSDCPEEALLECVMVSSPDLSGRLLLDLCRSPLRALSALP